MVKVLSIEKKKNKYIVLTNHDEYKFSEDVIIKYIITKGKEYSLEEFDEIISFSKKSEFYNKVLNFLSYKDRSISEVRNYLLEKECTIIDEIIEELVSRKLLDDKRYAFSYLESCINNLKGPLYLKQELTKKNIEASVINGVVSNYNYEQVNENLNLLVDKELRKQKIISFNKYKNQLTSKYLRLGYSISDVNYVLNNRKDDLINNVDELSSLEIDYYKLIQKGFNKDKLIKKLISKGYKYDHILEIVNNYNN